MNASSLWRGCSKYGLSATQLKFLGLILMLGDHIGAMFFPGLLWLRALGRLSMPIFCFFVAEGYAHTRSRGRYLLRLCMTGLISELLFDLAFHGGYTWSTQNVFFTFSLAVLSLWVADSFSETKTNAGMHSFLQIIPVIAAGMLAWRFHTDYSYKGVGLVAIYYWLRRTALPVRTGIGSLFLFLVRKTWIQRCSALSCFPLMLYNGERGKGCKWLFYGFYPAHLVLLWGIKCLINA